MAEEVRVEYAGRDRIDFVVDSFLINNMRVNLSMKTFREYKQTQQKDRCADMQSNDVQLESLTDVVEQSGIEDMRMKYTQTCAYK